MTNLRLCEIVFLALIPNFSLAQDPPPRSYVSHPNQQIRVRSLPSLKSVSKEAPDVLSAAVATVFNNQELCCDKDSALEDRLPQSDPVSLKSVGAALQGRHLLSDGRPIQITAEYFESASISSGKVVTAIAQQHAPLMVWNSNLYVVSGVIFDEAQYSDGSEIYVIRKFLLLDPRFSDLRRNVVFNRDTDDLNEIQGMLFLSAAPQ